MYHFLWYIHHLHSDLGERFFWRGAPGGVYHIEFSPWYICLPRSRLLFRALYHAYQIFLALLWGEWGHLVGTGSSVGMRGSACAYYFMSFMWYEWYGGYIKTPCPGKTDVPHQE